MTDENSLYSDPKQPDEFRTESPLRAFAEYTEYNGWMIAKGFRPSMQHLVRYLAAMERREGYRLVQILEAATGVPTMIFRTTARAPLDTVSDVFKSSEIERGNACVEYRIDPEKEKRAQELFDRNFGKSNATFSGPLDVSGHRPEIADYETDDEGKPWKLHVTFKGERATFFADFFRGDRREPTDHSSRYVVEWFDNVTQTAHRQPVAEWPEWAQKLVNALPYEKSDKPFNGFDWTPPEGSVYGFWADGRFFITFPHGVGGETARLAAPPGYQFYGFHDGSLQKTAFYTEVTSQSPVDVLETMAEGIADDLGIEVDRDSFQVAREHLEELVPVKFDDANPEHYNGWECGDIGERLTANGYQILKYCWRLGKKDDPCKELTKALRYLEREVDYINTVFPGHTLVPNFGGIAPSNRLNYMLDRTANQSQFTADVAMFLWNGYSAEMLDELKAMIVDHRFHLDCGNGLAI